MDTETVPLNEAKMVEDFTFLDDGLILYRRWLPTFVGEKWEFVEVQLYLTQPFVRTSPMSETRSYINRAVAEILKRNGAEIPR